MPRNIHAYFQLAKMIVTKVREIETEKQKIILVADDEPLTFSLIEDFFEAANLPYKILKAATGRVAYAIAVEQIPDLIITDWIMPELDGLSLIKQLKANPQTKDIPVIMTTDALIPNGEFNKILLAGAIDYIRKPLDDMEFMTRVKTALALGDALNEVKVHEESISTKNQFLHFLVDVAPNPIFVLDKTGYILECNESFGQLFRRTKPEILNHTIHELLPRFLNNFGEVSSVETNAISRFEIEYLDYVRGYRNLLLTCIGLGNVSSAIAIGSITDVTEIMQSNNKRLTHLEISHKKGKERIDGSVEKLQTALDFERREVALHLELLIHSRNVRKKLIAGVDKLLPYLTLEGKSKLYTLLKQVQWEVNDEISESIEKKFDESNAAFYSRLEQRCPEITKNEKRLCAYLKMNHGASDIAKITGKSLNSINVALARLRIKFHLPNTKDLRTHLDEFDQVRRKTA